MKQHKIAALVSTLLFVGSVASAAPSIAGETGAINTPTSNVASTVAAGVYHLQGDDLTASLSLGIAKNVEFTAMNTQLNHSGGKTLLGAKWNLLPESLVTPGIAVGVEDISNSLQRSTYAVASKEIPLTGITVSAGIGDGRFDSKPFFSLQKTINPLIVTGSNTFPATTLIAEYSGKTMNYGLRMSVVPGVKVDAGYQNHGFYLGASFSN